MVVLWYFILLIIHVMILISPISDCGLLMSQAIEETKGHVEKKQSYTYEEMEAEREEVGRRSPDFLRTSSIYVWFLELVVCTFDNF